MKPVQTIMLALAGVIAFTGPAAARSTGAMLDDCAKVAKSYYREGDARTDMKYNGQRTDGTHAVNGQIFLENRSAHFACSFNRNGQQMVEFYADGKKRNAYLPGSSGHGGSADAKFFRVTGVPSNDVLNVRSRPSASSAIVGVLANGDRVRNLGCRTDGGPRWCRIQMLDDMKSEGWVNARYLSTSGGSSASKPGLDHGGTIRNACARAVARKVGVSANDVIVTNSTISEGTGRHVVYVGVPNARADWICEADRRGNVVNVFYSGE